MKKQEDYPTTEAGGKGRGGRVQRMATHTGRNTMIQHTATFYTCTPVIGYSWFAVSKDWKKSTFIMS